MNGSVKNREPRIGGPATENPAGPAVELGCEICVQQEPAAWVNERAARASAVIRVQHLDHPDIRAKLLEVAADLCGLCQGEPDRAEGAATHARSLFATAVTPSSPRPLPRDDGQD